MIDDDLEEFGIAADPVGDARHAEMSVVSPPSFQSPSWSEILGEQTRGGAESFDASSILGDLYSNPAFKDLMAKRMAANRPLVKPISRTRPVDLSFAQVTLSPGQTASLQAQSYSLMRVNRIVATESVAGSTEITNMFIGSQRQFQNSIRSSVFSSSAVGTTPKLDTIQPGLPVTIQVTNTSKQDVQWSATLFGETIS